MQLKYDIKPRMKLVGSLKSLYSAIEFMVPEDLKAYEDKLWPKMSTKVKDKTGPKTHNAEQESYEFDFFKEINEFACIFCCALNPECINYLREILEKTAKQCERKQG